MPRPYAPVRRSLPHQVRIIGGQWKRTRLDVPDRPGLRPTPDRVRETLFNWLGQDLTGWRCVDAFAGTGALGLEAASRGAADVLLLEADAALVDALRAVVKRLDATNVRVQRGNALTALAALAPASIDLVFLDPPFDADLFDKALAAARPALTTVHNSLDEQAAAAIRVLQEIWRGEEPDSAQFVIPTRLIIRDSTAPPPPSH